MNIALFKHCSGADIPALGEFTAADVFVPGTTVDGVAIVWVGEHFRENLLPIREGPTRQTILDEQILQLEAADFPEKSRFVDKPGIVDCLGGLERVTIGLGQFWKYLTQADRTKWYVGYVLGSNEAPCVVHAGWMHGGLHIESGPLGRPNRWAIDSRFLVP